MHHGINTEHEGTIEPPRSRWNSIASFLSDKRILKTIGANLLELAGTALQITSEITTFVAGMGFFISPPLKKVYAHLQGKNMFYAVNGTGTLCVEMKEPFVIPTLPFNVSPNPNRLFNNSCIDIDNQALLSSDITFNLAYPESLFAASFVLLAVGCSGFMLAQILKKCGSRLHDSDNTMPPKEEDVALAKKWHHALLAISALSLVASRIAAVYATTTISMAMTLRKVPDILEDFSISSQKSFIYHQDNSTSDINPRHLWETFTMLMDFITTINFSALREAARKGSEEIDHYDYYIGIGVAGAALMVGYIALKTEQQHKNYSNILLRNEHYLEIKHFFEPNQVTPLDITTQSPLLEAERNRAAFTSSNVGSSPHSIFSTPHERSASPRPRAFCVDMTIVNR